MAETKTRQTEVSVSDFIGSVTDPVKRADSQRLIEIMTRISGEEPRMWGPTMVGFGKYAYKYDSGHSGEAMRVGFSPRKAALTLYLMPGFDSYEEQRARLGKHTVGKSCLYIKKLADVDMAVLEPMIADAWQRMSEMYPAK